jgi:hypothetical protein
VTIVGERPSREASVRVLAIRYLRVDRFLRCLHCLRHQTFIPARVAYSHSPGSAEFRQWGRIGRISGRRQTTYSERTLGNRTVRWEPPARKRSAYDALTADFLVVLQIPLQGGLDTAPAVPGAGAARARYRRTERPVTRLSHVFVQTKQRALVRPLAPRVLLRAKLIRSHRFK